VQAKKAHRLPRALRKQCLYEASFSSEFLRGESARDPHRDRERRIRGALLDRRALVLQSRLERLRECVYGVAARNFSEGKLLSQSFGGESKLAW
jgi:hypothetical protein